MLFPLPFFRFLRLSLVLSPQPDSVSFGSRVSGEIVEEKGKGKKRIKPKLREREREKRRQQRKEGGRGGEGEKKGNLLSLLFRFHKWRRRRLSDLYVYIVKILAYNTTPRSQYMIYKCVRRHHRHQSCWRQDERGGGRP